MYSEHLPLGKPPPGKGPQYSIRPDVPICPPPCECVDCDQQYRCLADQNVDRFVYERKISDSAAQSIAKECTTSIMNDLQFLRDRCCSHGNTIISRWKKKSRDKRQAFLLQVAPDMYPSLWFHPRLGYQFLNWKEARKYSTAWLLPYLSLEALKDDHVRLLSLLYNRTRYAPEQWAPFDNKQLTLAWQMGHISADFSRKCIVMQGSGYGNLTPYNERAAHRWDIVGFPRGKMILDAQRCLMGFLRKAVEQLLEGVDMTHPGASEKWAQMTSLGFKQTDSVEFWSPYLNQPFSAPPTFNVDNLVSFARTRLEASQDHLWLLQTDPAYLRRYSRILSAGAVIEGARRQDAHQIIGVELSRDAGFSFQWQWVLEECENVRVQYQRFRDCIHPGERLPPQYDRALGALELLLVNQMHHWAKHLTAFIPDRPGFRHAYSHDHSVPGQVSYQRTLRTPQGELFEKDRLDWCLTQLLGPPDQERRFDHAMLFAVLDDHLSKSSAAERARLDQALYDRLSDYAATHELLMAVRLHRPVNTNRDVSDVIKTEHRLAWRVMEDPDDHLPGSQKGLDVVGVGRKVQHLLELKPPSGKKDLDWLEQSEKVRMTLNTLWAQIRAGRESLLRHRGFTADEITAATEDLRAGTSAEHLADHERERERVLTDIRAPTAAATKARVQTMWGPDTESQPSALNIREQRKVKTRPEEPIVPEPQAKSDETIGHEGPPVHSTVPVRQQTLNTLSTMFPNDMEEAAKSVDWNAFVQAMADAKFTARHGGGSAVVFECESSSGKIVFHKPHPVAKIDPIMFRVMGKRMNKWFGWTRDTFALA